MLLFFVVSHTHTLGSRRVLRQKSRAIIATVKTINQNQLSCVIRWPSAAARACAAPTMIHPSHIYMSIMSVKHFIRRHVPRTHGTRNCARKHETLNRRRRCRRLGDDDAKCKCADQYYYILRNVMSVCVCRVVCWRL